MEEGVGSLSKGMEVGPSLTGGTGAEATSSCHHEGGLGRQGRAVALVVHCGPHAVRAQVAPGEPCAHGQPTLSTHVWLLFPRTW